MSFWKCHGGSDFSPSQLMGYAAVIGQGYAVKCRHWTPPKNANLTRIRGGVLWGGFASADTPSRTDERLTIKSQAKIVDWRKRQMGPKGYNTFDVRQPALMKEWLMAENILLGILPDEILETSTEKVWWRCLECDYKYLLTPRKRVLKKKRGHNSCPRCKGHRWLQVHFV